MTEVTAEKIRMAAGLEYDGRRFCGWQRQTDRRSVQEVVERALGFVANGPVQVVCAGRTDAGVHALEQVIHFDTRAERRDDAWIMGGNCNLPEDVRIVWARRVENDFNARSQALARYYRYEILNRRVRSALNCGRVTCCHTPLDVEAMQEAAGYLIGEHDFSSFRARQCQSRSPRRMLYRIDIDSARSPGADTVDRIGIDVVGNAFLHHMVRNIAGVLMEIGVGKKPPLWAREVLMRRDRSAAGITAPADGLYLAGVCYPAWTGIHRHPVFGRLPPDIRRFG